MTEAQQRLAKIHSILNDFKAGKFEQSQHNTEQPLLSIVTIYDEINEAKWLCDFKDSLPKCDPGKVELILCKTVKDSATKERPKAPQVINGIQVHYVAVYLPEWSFSDARNAAKQAANGKWILSLDTDEVVVESELQKVFEAIKKADSATMGFSIKVFSEVGENGEENSLAPITRIFRNDSRIHWKCAIHETVLFSIYEIGSVVKDLDVTIFHSGYKADERTLISKLQRNIELLCREYTKYKPSHIRDYLHVHLYRTINELERRKNE
jgi:hypothetical protein